MKRCNISGHSFNKKHNVCEDCFQESWDWTGDNE